MSHALDIKPCIGPCPQAHRSRPRTNLDIKPTLPDEADIKPLVDFKKERETLKKHFEQDSTILDLREENHKVKEEKRRLRARQRVIKVEAGIVDVKPNLVEFGHGENVMSTGKRPPLDDSDDDGIVYIREVKAKRSEHRVANRPSLPLTTGPSEGNTEVILPLNPNTPHTATENDRHHHSNHSVPLSATIDIKPSSTSLSKQPKRGTKTREIRERQDSILSYGSSAPEPRMDLNNSYGGRQSIKPVRARVRKAGRQSGPAPDTGSSSRRISGAIKAKSGGTSRGSDIIATGACDQANTDPSASESDESSGDDEFNGPYKGPHLKVLSVQAINDRLERSHDKYETTLENLRQWAAWWPKAQVVKHHKLNAGEVWILMVAVHEWWSDLLLTMESQNCEWRAEMGEADKEDMRLRVKEITLSKEMAVVSAKRTMLRQGESIPVDSVIDLRTAGRGKARG